MPRSLVILPCHSIWKGGNSAGVNPEEWILASFQLEGRDHLCFLDHIRTSLGRLENEDDGVLIISGGRTKKELSDSEASSYLKLAKAMNGGAVSSRIFLEENARDSFENVLFLILKFEELFQKYPERIIVVGFEFKRARFMELHLNRALGFPLQNITYIGNSPSPDCDLTTYKRNLEYAELKYGYKPFKNDLYGVGEYLSEKRSIRDPHNSFSHYSSRDSKLSDFISYMNSFDSEPLREIHPAIKFPWNR